MIIKKNKNIIKKINYKKSLNILLSLIFLLIPKLIFTKKYSPVIAGSTCQVTAFNEDLVTAKRKSLFNIAFKYDQKSRNTEESTTFDGKIKYSKKWHH